MGLHVNYFVGDLQLDNVLTKKVKPSMFHSAFTLYFTIHLDQYFVSGSDEQTVK